VIHAEDLLFVGTYGHVRAVGKKNGRKVWNTSLPGTGYDIVTLLHEDGVLFAASKGRLFALDASTGEILWKNGLRGLSSVRVELATARSSSDALAALAAGQDVGNRTLPRSVVL